MLQERVTIFNEQAKHTNTAVLSETNISPNKYTGSLERSMTGCPVSPEEELVSMGMLKGQNVHKSQVGKKHLCNTLLPLE